MSFDLALPDFILAVYGWIGRVFGLWFEEMASPECAVPLTYTSRWSLRSLGPFTLMLPFAIMAWLSPAQRARAINALVMLAAILYINILSTSMEPWACPVIARRARLRVAL